MRAGNRIAQKYLNPQINPLENCSGWSVSPNQEKRTISNGQQPV